MVKRRISPKESVMHSSHLLAAGGALEVEPVPQYGRPGPLLIPMKLLNDPSGHQRQMSAVAIQQHLPDGIGPQRKIVEKILAGPEHPVGYVPLSEQLKNVRYTRAIWPCLESLVVVLLVILLNPFTLASLLFNSRATDTEFLETIVLFLVFSGGVIVLWLIPILWAGLLISVVSKAVRKISAALREGTTYEDFWFFLVYNRPVDKGSMYRYELDEEPNQKIIGPKTHAVLSAQEAS